MNRWTDKTMLLDALRNHANVNKNHLSYKNFKTFLCETIKINLYLQIQEDDAGILLLGNIKILHALSCTNKTWFLTKKIPSFIDAQL